MPSKEESKVDSALQATTTGPGNQTHALNSPPPPISPSLSSKRTQNTSIARRIYIILTWTPPRCRWDPSKPPQFSMALNVLFAFAAGFTVANLYYSHPILNIMADEFGVKYEHVAQIPTVMQAGYATGLLFLCPLGDLLPRRPFVVGLVGFTATVWLGLCLTSNLAVFTALSYIVAVTTVTPQLMLPLVGDLAPPHRRAAALSVVVSGLQLGILIARVLSGTMTNFVSWRAVYWLAFGLQYGIFILLWLFMPDYPSTNTDLNYFKLLWSIVKMLGKHAVLVQACIAAFLTSATFTSFWTTLTFLLAGPPYHYAPLIIGLFGLIGIAAMFFGPFYARFVIDKFVPHMSALVGQSCCLLGICLGTYIGPFNVSGPILQAFLADFGMQTAQIALRSSVYSIEPKRRNGVNTAYMIFTFCGQLVGTTAGSRIYARAGWIGSGSASVGFMGLTILVMLARGPWETRWVGWRGGWSFVKKDMNSADGKANATAHAMRDNQGDEEMGVATDGAVVDESKSPNGTSEAHDLSEKSLRNSKDDMIRPVKS